MEIRARRTAYFPGEPVRVAVSIDASEDIVWSGGGEPSSGTGSHFRTTFTEGGVHTIRAESADALAQLPITVCRVGEWLERAATFFGPSLDLRDVRVKSSRVVVGKPRSAWTCNTVIRFKRPMAADDLPSESVLIHELGHVWEHRSGQTQLLSGLVEQLGRRLRGRDPYDYGGPAGLRNVSPLTRFSKESQAQIVTELWKADHGETVDRLNVPFATPGYVDDLRRLVREAGIGTTDPRRRTVAGSVDAIVAAVVNAILAPFD